VVHHQVQVRLVSENNLGLSPSPAAYGSEGAVSSVSCTSSLSVRARLGWRCSAAGVLCWLRCRALASLLLAGAVSLPLELLRRRLRTLDMADRWGIDSPPWRPFTCKLNQSCLTPSSSEAAYLPTYRSVLLLPDQRASYLPTWLMREQRLTQVNINQSINQIRDTKLVQMLQDCEGKLM